MGVPYIKKEGHWADAINSLLLRPPYREPLPAEPASAVDQPVPQEQPNTDDQTVTPPAETYDTQAEAADVVRQALALAGDSNPYIITPAESSSVGGGSGWQIITPRSGGAAESLTNLPGSGGTNEIYTTPSGSGRGSPLPRPNPVNSAAQPLAYELVINDSANDPIDLYLLDLDERDRAAFLYALKGVEETFKSAPPNSMNHQELVKELEQYKRWTSEDDYTKPLRVSYVSFLRNILLSSQLPPESTHPGELDNLGMSVDEYNDSLAKIRHELPETTTAFSRIGRLIEGSKMFVYNGDQQRVFNDEYFNDKPAALQRIINGEEDPRRNSGSIYVPSEVLAVDYPASYFTKDRLRGYGLGEHASRVVEAALAGEIDPEQAANLNSTPEKIQQTLVHTFDQFGVESLDSLIAVFRFLEVRTLASRAERLLAQAKENVASELEVARTGVRPTSAEATSGVFPHLLLALPNFNSENREFRVGFERAESLLRDSARSSGVPTPDTRSFNNEQNRTNAGDVPSGESNDSGSRKLSPFEAGLVRMAADGLTSRQMADKTTVSYRIVEKTLREIYMKLDVNDSQAMVEVVKALSRRPASGDVESAD